MRVVVALGGNALLRRNEPLTAEHQKVNVQVAAEALAPIARANELLISHGNGPQVGLLALQGAAFRPDLAYPLDVLDAETEGMIGYLIEQALTNVLSTERQCATLLTQIEVDASDSAFRNPTKPIGPVYEETEARQLSEKWGWIIARDGDAYRRVVASPRPKRILELAVIELLVNQGVIVICAGGGGIPVICREDGSLIGVEAVIDKDLASGLLARQLHADALLMLTDMDAVYSDWGKPTARAIRRTSPQSMRGFAFEAGSMGPKVEAAIEFVEKTGGTAGIGALAEAGEILAGEAGTTITRDAADVCWGG